MGTVEVEAGLGKKREGDGEDGQDPFPVSPRLPGAPGQRAGEAVFRIWTWRQLVQ